MRPSAPAKLDRIAARYAAKPNVSAMCFAIEQPSTGFTWRHGDTGRPYFIASITKLFTVALVMQRRDEGALTLDTNYQLLGRVIEVVTAGSYHDAVRDRIINPLGLSGTWLFTPDMLDRCDEVAPVRHGRTPLRVPKAIASFPSEGAMVSTPLTRCGSSAASWAGSCSRPATWPS